MCVVQACLTTPCLPCTQLYFPFLFFFFLLLFPDNRRHEIVFCYISRLFKRTQGNPDKSLVFLFFLKLCLITFPVFLHKWSVSLFACRTAQGNFIERIYLPRQQVCTMKSPMGCVFVVAFHHWTICLHENFSIAFP